MTDRNVPVTKGVANDRELTRLMAGLPGMVYRASAQPPFAFEIVGGDTNVSWVVPWTNSRRSRTSAPRSCIPMTSLATGQPWRMQ